MHAGLMAVHALTLSTRVVQSLPSRDYVPVHGIFAVVQSLDGTFLKLVRVSAVHARMLPTARDRRLIGNVMAIIHRSVVSKLAFFDCPWQVFTTRIKLVD